jgi:carbon-monoxide dehydrogenase iron sulfur subunit
MKRIIYREEVCMGCGLCEINCIVDHSKSKDFIKAYRKEEPRPSSRIRVEVQHPQTLAVQCQHCKDHPCVMACLSGAMRKDAGTGLVVYESERCVGCWTCIMVCPYGALKVDPVNHKAVAKCDLCGESDVPACVAGCPNEALLYQEVVP